MGRPNVRRINTLYIVYGYRLGQRSFPLSPGSTNQIWLVRGGRGGGDPGLRSRGRVCVVGYLLPLDGPLLFQRGSFFLTSDVSYLYPFRWLIEDIIGC